MSACITLHGKALHFCCSSSRFGSNESPGQFHPLVVTAWRQIRLPSGRTAPVCLSFQQASWSWTGKSSSLQLGSRSECLNLICERVDFSRNKGLPPGAECSSLNSRGLFLLGTATLIWFLFCVNVNVMPKSLNQDWDPSVPGTKQTEQETIPPLKNLLPNTQKKEWVGGESN